MIGRDGGRVALSLLVKPLGGPYCSSVGWWWGWSPGVLRSSPALCRHAQAALA